MSTGCRRLLPVVLVAWTLAAGLRAEAPEPLTLERAIESALAGSPRLAAAEAEAGVAAAALAEARAGRKPSVTLSQEALRTDNPTLVFSNKLGQERFTADDFAIDLLNRPDPLSNFRTRLTVEAPLVTFGRLRHGTAAAELGLEGARRQRDRARQAVAHEVVAAFVAALTAERDLAAARAVADTVAVHRKLTSDLYEAGLVVESDVLHVEVRASEVDEMVARAESGVAVTRADLNRAMGLPQSTAWRLEAPAPEAAPPPPPVDDVDDLVAEARRSRPDLAAAEAAVEAARELHSAARASRRPQLAAGGFLEANADEVGSVDGDNWGVRLDFRWVLFDGLASSARVERAEQQLLAAEAHLALAAAAAELEVRRSVQELVVATKREALGRRAVELATRALAIVEDRYREGLATVVELAEAESALAQARAREAAADGELVRARSGLDLAVGRL